MKRGTAAKVILGKDTLMDVPAGIVHGTDVILGGKAGLLNDFGGLVLSNNLMIGKKVSRGTITTVTVRGVAPIILPDAITGSLHAVKAFGGTEQNGTPTPDAPIDIVSNNGVLKYSKNLLDMSEENIVLGKYINNSGVISDSTPNFYNSKYIPVVAGGTYTWSTSSSTKYFSVMEYDSNYAFKKRTLFSNAGTSGSITLRSDTAFVLIGSNIDSTDVTLDKITAVDWQFEKGSIATPYMPYGQVYTDGTVETINVHGKNLFDKNVALLGDISTNGAYVSRTYRVVSDYIPVKFGQTFVGSGTLRDTDGVEYDAAIIKAFYKADKSYIAGTRGQIPGRKVVIDDNECAYIRVVFYSSSLTAGKTASIENSTLQLEEGNTPTAYQPYFDGGTATAEMLLKVGDYQDVQSIIDGVVTRNVGVKVLDGTENWVLAGSGAGARCHITEDIGLPNTEDLTSPMMCSHYSFGGYISGGSSTTVGTFNAFSRREPGNEAYYLRFSVVGMGISSATDFKNWLADQYAAGTPVIVIYPLATPTTESVAGQPLQVTAGDNVLEITQASLTGLELEATYKSLVQLTIQEVEDANLNNNVEVTIS